MWPKYVFEICSFFRGIVFSTICWYPIIVLYIYRYFFENGTLNFKKPHEHNSCAISICNFGPMYNNSFNDFSVGSRFFWSIEDYTYFYLIFCMFGTTICLKNISHCWYLHITKLKVYIKGGAHRSAHIEAIGYVFRPRRPMFVPAKCGRWCRSTGWIIG